MAGQSNKVVFRYAAPAKPWSTNQDRNLNQYVRHELIHHWKQVTKYEFISYVNRNDLRLPLEPGVVTVAIPFSQNRRRDPHNYCGTVVKAVIDGLVLAGAWPDDTPEWVGHREPVLVAGNVVVVAIDPKMGTDTAWMEES
jgi:hypothetical protein